MTVNIGLVTGDALVLGCDSIASVSNYFLDPFVNVDLDGEGNPVLDESGKLCIRFETDDLQSIVTDAWGNVTKMFPIHQGNTNVVAVTAGLAKMCDRPISSLGAEFLAKRLASETQLVTVEEIAKSFQDFMREKYDEHYGDSPIPPRFRDGPEFLVGGFGRDDDFPSLYRLNIQANTTKPSFADGHAGLAWNGQSDAVERFIKGFDGPLQSDVASCVEEALEKYHSEATVKVAEIVNTVLAAVGAEMPPDIDAALPNPGKVSLPWKNYRLRIAYSNLPLQEAIHLVSFLVNLQSGKARFAPGVATVGGRVHIGVVTKSEGFKLLNEPNLVHKYTGFSDDPQ